MSMGITASLSKVAAIAARVVPIVHIGTGGRIEPLWPKDICFTAKTWRNYPAMKPSNISRPYVVRFDATTISTV
jgi:hypothetical protein